MLSLNHPNPEVRALASKVAERLRKLPMNEAIYAVAQVVTPIASDRSYTEDIWAQILNEQDWTQVPLHERKFKAPKEVVGATRILKYQNGQTFSQFTFVQRQVSVEGEAYTTPEFTIDTAELQATDPIATVGDVEDAVTRMILIEKARRGYFLLTHGYDDPTEGTGNVKVFVDDGSYDSQNQLAFLRALRDHVEDTVQALQSRLGGRPVINLVATQLTLDRLKRSGLTADWDRELGVGGPGPNPSNVQYKPALKTPLRPYPMMESTDDINGNPDAANARPIITEGDLLLVGPNAAAQAKVKELEPSIIQKDHWQVAYAWRGEWAWVRWSDKGDTNKIRRIIVIRTVAAGGEQGELTIDNVTSDGANLYCSRPLDKRTIDETTLLFANDADGANVVGKITPLLKGDLRHFRVTFGTPQLAGKKLYVRSTNGLKDLAGDSVKNLTNVEVRVG